MFSFSEGKSSQQALSDHLKMILQQGLDGAHPDFKNERRQFKNRTLLSPIKKKP